MPRHETLRQPAAWLLAASGLILYLWAPITVPADHAVRAAGVSAWLPVAAPVVLYGLLLAGLPGVPLFRRIAGALILCLAHAGLGLSSVAFYAVTALVPPDRSGGDVLWTYPAAAIIQLLAVPLVAFPFRDFLLARTGGARGRRDAMGRGLTPPPVADDEWVPFGVGARDDTPGRITPAWSRPLPDERRPTPPPMRPTPPPMRPTPPPTQSTPVAPWVAAPTPTIARTERRGLFEVSPTTPTLPAPAASPPPAALVPPAAPPHAPAASPPAPPLGVVTSAASVEASPEAPPVTEPAGRTSSPPRPAPIEPVAVPEPPVTVSRTSAPAPAPVLTAELASPAAPAAVVVSRAELPVADLIPTREHVVEVQRMAAILRPAGRLGASVQTLMGITLLAVCSPRLARGAVVGPAFRILSLLADCPLPVTQATLRGPAGAIVLTPVGPLDSGGPVIVAATPVRGSLALLELLSRRAAATAHPGVRRAAPAPAVRPTMSAPGELRDAPVPLRLLQLARSVGAWGPLAPRAFQDREGDLLLYLLLAPGVDAHEVGRFARQLWQVMDAEEAPGGIGPIGSLDLRLGDERVVVRRVAGAPGQSTVLVAAGPGADRPGLAHREVERVAARLVAAS